MHINKINFKKYVGQSCYDWKDIEMRFLGGNGYKGCATFYSAIMKYGWDNFYHVCLHDGVPEDDLDWLEIMSIRWEGSHVSEWGYNVRRGGKGYANKQEVRKKISLSAKEYQRSLSEYDRWHRSEIHKKENLSESTRKKLSLSKSGKNHHFYGKHLSEETKKKMSISRRGQKRTDETRKRISEANKGKVLSDSHLEAILESKKRPVMAINTKTGEKRSYSRVAEMCSDLNIKSTTSVYKYLNGIKTSPYKGWIFQLITQ